MTETVHSGLRYICASFPLFRSLDAAAQHSLESELTRHFLRGGETLFAAGEAGDCLYVVLYGRLMAERVGEAGAREVLGEIARGESVGELALLTDGPRMASVRAIRDTELVRLSRDSFQRLVVTHPQVMLELTRQIIARQQRAGLAARQARPMTLALIPTGPDVPIREFAAGLVAALPGRRVRCLDPEEVARSRADGSAGDELAERALAGWLQEQELSHDYVVYVAEPAATGWTARSLRQADRALIVGAGDGYRRVDPAVWQLLHGNSGPATSARNELVLLYDSTRGEPAGTTAWLSRFAVQRHHHVDPRRPRDLARLARMLTDTATGLVLGGGGARGLAHLGVLRALEEAEVPIDLIGGTSIGSIIGAEFACGWDSRRIIEESRRALLERGSLYDYTLPLMSLLEGRRFSSMLESLFGERRIEDLPLPFFCTSTNLTRGAGMVHHTGLLRKWLAASAAVPGLSPPVFDSCEILVDGGVCNNLPIDVMRGLTAGPVLAVGVSAGAEMRLEQEYPDMLSPWRVLLSRLNPFGTPIRVPGLVSILMRTATLPPKRIGASDAVADLTFLPPVSGYRLLDWHAFDQLVEIGYHSARETLDQWNGSSALTATQTLTQQ
jgi:predicted acylesterase/phospholipase RssA/CRP-like cAMP-binding protein